MSEKMAKLKDLIPEAKDGDSNSGDSWFVLSSASEEDDEPETKKLNLEKLENLVREESRKKENAPEFVKQNHSNGDVEVEKDHIHIEKLEVPEIQQKEVAETTEQIHIEKLEVPEIQQKEVAETTFNEENKQEKEVENEIKELENEIKKDEKQTPYDKDPSEEWKTYEEVTKKPVMVKEKQKAKPIATDKRDHSEIALEVHALRETLIQLSLNLSNVEEVKYNSIASEVQAMRETLTQFSNDLSNRMSQVESRAEQVHTLLCRFIMNRCSSFRDPPTQSITTSTEHHSDAAVQTEMPETKQGITLKSHESQNASEFVLSDSNDLSNASNTTDNEESLAKLFPVIKTNYEKNSQNEPKVLLPTPDGKKSQTIPKALLPTPDEKKIQTTSKALLPTQGDKRSQTAPKTLLPTPDFPSQESKLTLIPLEFTSKDQIDSPRLKRPRLDNEASEITEDLPHDSGISEKGSSLLLRPTRQHVRGKFSKERSHHDQNKPKHLKKELCHDFRESFQHYPSAHHSYNSNQELADLAYHYSSNDSNNQRQNKSNCLKKRQGREVDNGRKYSNSKHMLEETVSTGFLDELDMVKVIDEWAEDED